MKKKCPNCRLVNYPNAEICSRCGIAFRETGSDARVKSTIVRRFVICVTVSFAAVAGFYASMVFSAASLSYEQKKIVQRSIQVLEEKGFSNEVFVLKRLAAYRGNDNWLNASVAKESAFAATNFPFEIVTLYSDFFDHTADDTERAAILLHEARHLKGEDEKEAYEFVWRNRKKLGWVSETYGESEVWNEVRKQTREFAPNLFVCDTNPLGDCTE
ncbi:MAG: hypothetical protein ABIU09_00615 [Pyrinomonadaceae bacterium]